MAGLVGCETMWVENKDDEIDFVTQVKPILEHRCMECHSGVAPAGGLAFHNREVMLKTFRGGSKLIDPGYPDRSLLFLAVSRFGAHPTMMPGDGWRLTEGQRNTLREWIAQGAEWPKGASGRLERKETIIEMDEAP